MGDLLLDFLIAWAPGVSSRRALAVFSLWSGVALILAAVEAQTSEITALVLAGAAANLVVSLLLIIRESADRSWSVPAAAVNMVALCLAASTL